MHVMHESTARRCAARLGVAAATLAVLLGTASAGAAEPASPDGEHGGLWAFVTIAFLVAAGASFAAGVWRARARQADTPGEGREGREIREGRNGPEAHEAAGAQACPAEPAEPALLRDLAQALALDARPVLLLAAPTADAPRVLAQANAAALRLLGLGPEACGQAWTGLELAAPAALRQALADAAASGPWWVLRDPAGSACLALGPDGTGEEEVPSLVYTVTHDLRAPIRVVEGFTRIVKEDYGPQLDRVGHDHLDRVLAAGARMNQMIDAMLTMARLASQPLTRQPVDLSQTARWVLDELARSAPGREVDVSVQPGLRAHGDPTLLRLVLENLLGNAWKYSARSAAARIEFLATDVDGRRTFVVRDNGAGFDMRGAERLFGLFQRLHSAKDFAGTGVGLASVRRIVQRHGGQIWAEAEPGRGAAFYFTLTE